MRLINIPSVHYQYFITGIYQTLKTEFVKVPAMAGWLEPEERVKIIVDMYNKAKDIGLIPIPLDFRKFDTRMLPQFKHAVTSMFLDYFHDTPERQQIKEQVRQLYLNQYLVAPLGKDHLNMIELPRLFASGMTNTQMDGSAMNNSLANFIMMRLGISEEDIIRIGTFRLTLGDDLVLWLPKSMVDEHTYGGILKKIQEALDDLGMVVHVDKRYPLPQVMFLQHLYVPEHDIIHEYSLVRNIDSLVYAEKFHHPIEGIKNLIALDTIGQISTLNQSMLGKGEVSLKKVCPLVVRK